MNRSLLTRLREFLEPVLDRSAPTGVLSDDERRTVYALFRVLTADESYPEAPVRQYVQRRTKTEPGYFKEYRRGLALLEKVAERESPGRRFADLTDTERNRVLRRVLRSYPHEEKNALWRRRLRLTSENLDVVAAAFGRQAARRFRMFVVRDLLEHYYTGPAGWAVVDYKEFPGRVKSESDPCEVVGFRIEGDALILELSDATYEKLDPRRLELDGESGLAVTTKSGRQRARFSRKAYQAISEYLEETEDGRFVLMIGSSRHKVFQP